MTLRDRLREVADQYKGLAALAGSFMAGGLLVASSLGVIQLPQENARDLAELRRETSEEIAALEADLTARDAGLQEQVDGIVEQLNVQTTLLCIIAVRLDEGLVEQCPVFRPLARRDLPARE